MSSRKDTEKLQTNCTEPTKWGKQVLRDVLVLRQHPQHRGPDGKLDNADLDICDPMVTSQRDVKIKKICNKRARSSSQWVPEVPQLAETDPALMLFSEDEPEDYDPFELGFDAGEPGVATAHTTGSSSSSSSSSAAVVVQAEAIPQSIVLSEIQRERIARSKPEATSKTEARKCANAAQRKKAIARKLQLEGIGALTGEQRDLLMVEKVTRCQVVLIVDSGSSESVGVKKAVMKHSGTVWGSAWRR